MIQGVAPGIAARQQPRREHHDLVECADADRAGGLDLPPGEAGDLLEILGGRGDLDAHLRRRALAEPRRRSLRSRPRAPRAPVRRAPSRARDRSAGRSARSRSRPGGRPWRGLRRQAAHRPRRAPAAATAGGNDPSRRTASAYSPAWWAMRERSSRSSGSRESPSRASASRAPGTSQRSSAAAAARRAAAERRRPGPRSRGPAAAGPSASKPGSTSTTDSTIATPGRSTCSAAARRRRLLKGSRCKAGEPEE